MAIILNQMNNVEMAIKDSLRNKFKDYKPETSYMPFHTRLLGKDRMALFSFIQSLNTNFGTSIFEPVSIEIAKNKFKEVRSHYIVNRSISEEAQKTIQIIMDDLTTASTKPMKLNEIECIRKVCQKGKMKVVKPTVVDVYLLGHDKEIFLIDLKTTKPNKGGFREFKRTLLEWTACVLAESPDAIVNTLIAIPYNPYHPKPYSRWTMAGMLDLENELLVAEEYWDFIGGTGTFAQLLYIFEKVGIEMRAEIDDYFNKFKINNNHNI